MKGLFNILLLSMTLAAFTSCVKGDLVECPPFNVRIVVKDKNYFNVDKVDSEQRLPEDKPFTYYVPTLHYTVRNADTGELLDHRDIFNVDPTVDEVNLTFSHDIPYGHYICTVWGNLTDSSILTDKGQSALLHPENLPGEDIYMVNDTIIYDYRHDTVVMEMERVKGKLIVEVENLPQPATGIAKTINNLRDEVHYHFAYTGNTYVSTNTTFDGPETSFVDKSFLAISTGDRNSTASTTLSQADEQTTSLDPVNITILRNSITVIRYVWDEETGKFNIFVLLDNSWDKEEDLGIEEE